MRAKALVWGPFLNYLSKEVVFKLFIKGVCFYLHYAKGRGIIQQGVDMWHWAVVSKALCNRLLQLQWCNHFWTGYVNVCSVDAFGNVCCYSCSDATTLDFIFSRSLHSVLFNVSLRLDYSFKWSIWCWCDCQHLSCGNLWA